MSEKEKVELLKFIIKCGQTIIITILTAMVLGFFSYLGWLGANLVEIKANQQTIIKELSIQEAEKAMLAEELIKENFEVKEKVKSIEEPKIVEQLPQLPAPPPAPVRLPDVERELERELEEEKPKPGPTEEELFELEQKRVEQEKQERFQIYKQQFEQKIAIPRENINQQIKK